MVWGSTRSLATHFLKQALPRSFNDVGSLLPVKKELKRQTCKNQILFVGQYKCFMRSFYDSH